MELFAQSNKTAGTICKTNQNTVEPFAKSHKTPWKLYENTKRIHGDCGFRLKIFERMTGTVLIFLSHDTKCILFFQGKTQTKYDSNQASSASSFEPILQKVPFKL